MDCQKNLPHCRHVYRFSIKWHNKGKNEKKKKKKWNTIFIDEKIAIRVIKDYKTTSAHKPRTRLGFK